MTRLGESASMRVKATPGTKEPTQGLVLKPTFQLVMTPLGESASFTSPKACRGSCVKGDTLGTRMLPQDLVVVQFIIQHAVYDKSML
jgi:hypothetical protein